MERVRCQWFSDPRFNEDQRTQCSIIKISLSWCKLSTSTSTVSTHAHLPCVVPIAWGFKGQTYFILLAASFCVKSLLKIHPSLAQSRPWRDVVFYNCTPSGVVGPLLTCAEAMTKYSPPGPSTSSFVALQDSLHKLHWNVKYDAPAPALRLQPPPRTAASLNIYNDKMQPFVCLFVNI